MRRAGSHLTYANVMSTLAVFLVLGGGTALAAYVVTDNSDVAPGTISGHNPPAGDHSNIIQGSIESRDIQHRAVGGSQIDFGAVGLENLDSSLQQRQPQRLDFVANSLPASQIFQPGDGNSLYALKVTCNSGLIALFAGSNAPGASLNLMWADGGSTDAHTAGQAVHGLVPIAQLTGSGTGVMVYRDDTATITIPFHYVQTSTGCRFFGESTLAS